MNIVSIGEGTYLWREELVCCRFFLVVISLFFLGFNRCFALRISRSTVHSKPTNQIPMRSMELNPHEPALLHETGRVDELADNVLNLRDGHLPRGTEEQRPEEIRQQAVPDLDRDRAGRERFGEEPPPARAQGGLPARMADLDDAGRAVLLAGVRVSAPDCQGLRVKVTSVGGCPRGRGVAGASEVVDVHMDIPCILFDLAMKLLDGHDPM